MLQIGSYPWGDFPMTFQIAVGASNGWIIASDTKENRYAGASSRPSFRETVNTKKITYHAKTRTVYAPCGDEVMRQAGRRVIELYQNEFGEYPRDSDLFKARLEAVGDETWENLQAEKLPPQYRKAIFAFDNCRSFWTLELPLPGQEHSCASFTYDRVFNGDPTNPAKFFIEKYHDYQLPVRSLSPLAAHTILMGATLNPSGIGGLEILFCEDGVIVDWEFGSPELLSLAKHSTEIDAQIQARLLHWRE